MLVRLDSEHTLPPTPPLTLPSFTTNELNGPTHDVEPRLSDDDEDALLKDTTSGFAHWIDSFMRRMIQLLENLPEEGENSSTGGETEGTTVVVSLVCTYLNFPSVQVVDDVTRACSQICVHLSDRCMI